MWRALSKAAAVRGGAGAHSSRACITSLQSAQCVVASHRSMHVGAAGSSRTAPPGRSSSGVGGGRDGFSAMRGSGGGVVGGGAGVGASAAATSSAARAAAAAAKAAAEAAALRQQQQQQHGGVDENGDPLGSAEEMHQMDLDDEVEMSRTRHFDLEAWKRGGALPPGRVLDINPDDAPLTSQERAGVLAELTMDLPMTMAEFAQLRLAGFTDDGTSLQEPRFPTLPLPRTGLTGAEKEAADAEAAERALEATALAEASEWIPADDLAAVLELQDQHSPPTTMKVHHAEEAEKRDSAKRRMGDARRKRYCALVSHTGWLWTRVQTLLDSPVGWSCDDQIRWRFVAEQLQRCYQSALQSLAYFSVYSVHMSSLGPDATDAMARQSWAALAHVTARMSHTQEEALLVLEHLAQWNADDVEAGVRRTNARSDDTQREMAAVHSFCSEWGRAIEAEHAHLRECGDRVANWATDLRAGRAIDEAEYGLQHYAGEALQSLTRISHALLQEPSEADQAAAIALQERDASGAQPDQSEADIPTPHYRDVLGAVHASQYAVGLVWRFASLLDSKSEQLQRHLAEAQCRDAGETELADKLSLSIANAGAAQVARLVEQHANWAQTEALDQEALLATAIMQEARTPKLMEGLDAFFHFMDRVTKEAATEHQWNLVILSTRNDAAAAYTQLAEALRAWKQDAETVRATDPEGALTEEELKRLQQCIDGAVGCAGRIAQMQPNHAAAARVQSELEAVDSADLKRIVTDVSSGRDSPL